MHPRHPFQSVAGSEVVALGLGLAQMPAQTVKLVQPLRRLGAEFRQTFRRGHPDLVEAVLESQSGQPLGISVKLFLIDFIGAVVLGVHLFRHPRFHVVGDQAVCRWLLRRPSRPPFGLQPHFGGDTGHVQCRKDLQRGSIDMHRSVQGAGQTAQCRLQHV
ncbi:hypothetical protein ACFQ4K_05305 [Tistrella bauzanensis]